MSYAPSSPMGSGSQPPHRPSSAAPGPPRSYINTFMTPPSQQQLQHPYLDGNSYPVMPTHTPHRVASPAPQPVRPVVRPGPNYGNVAHQRIPPAAQSPALLPPERFANPYDSLQTASASAPSLPHIPASDTAYSSQSNYAGPSRAPAFFGPGDPLNSSSNTHSLPPQSRPQPPQRLASAPNSMLTTRSRIASNSGQTLPSTAPQGPNSPRIPGGSSQSAIERHPRAHDRLPSAPVPPSPRTQSLQQGHAFDDCEGCRAELEDAIKASLQSAQDEQKNRSRMEQEELDRLLAITSSENDAQKRRAEEEEQLLQQAIASSKRDAELQAQRNAEHESLILEESRQHALRQQEQQAREEQSMLEAAKLASRAEDERRRQAVSAIQDAEKRALEESLREQEQEWLRRESAEQSLLAFFQHRDASSPSSSRIAPPPPPKSRPVSMQADPSPQRLADQPPSRSHTPLQPQPHDSEAEIEAEYWKFAGHDEAYRLALQINKVSLDAPEQSQPVAGPSRSSRPLPAPPGAPLTPKPLPSPSKAVEAFSLLHGDDNLSADVPPPAYEEATSPTAAQHSAPSMPNATEKGAMAGTASPVAPTPYRPTPILPQLKFPSSNDAAGRRPQPTLSPIVEVNSAGSSVISVKPASLHDVQKTTELNSSSRPASPALPPKPNGDSPTPVSTKRMSSLTMNSRPPVASRTSDPASPLTAASPDLESPSGSRHDSSLLQVPERGSSSSFATPPSNRSSMSLEPRAQAAIAGIDFGFAALPFATKLEKSMSAAGKPGFPPAIRLSHFGAVARRMSTESAEGEPRCAPFFVIRAHSWKSLLRAIAWYGNCKVEAGPEEAAASPCVLRAEIEFVTPARTDTGYGVGDYARYAQTTGVMPKSQSPAHVSLCMSLFPTPSSAAHESRAEAYLKSDEYQTAKRESKRLDAWYAGKGSTRRLIQLSRQPPTLPMALVQLAQHLHAAHSFSAACPSSGSTARHSPRDLHHAIERHDEDFITKQKAMLAAGAVLNSASGSSLPLNRDDDAEDDEDDEDLDFNDFTLLENGLAGNGSFDAQDQELMGKRARLKGKIKRRLAKRSTDGRVVDEDLATWITPFDLSQHS